MIDHGNLYFRVSMIKDDSLCLRMVNSDQEIMVDNYVMMVNTVIDHNGYYWFVIVDSGDQWEIQTNEWPRTEGKSQSICGKFEGAVWLFGGFK